MENMRRWIGQRAQCATSPISAPAATIRLLAAIFRSPSLRRVVTRNWRWWTKEAASLATPMQIPVQNAIPRI